MPTGIIPLNKILFDHQLNHLLRFLLKDRQVEIIRLIPQTGKSNVTWIHYRNKLTNECFATFIAFQDLTRIFWWWVEKINYFLLSFSDKLSISKFIWQCININETVMHQRHGWVTVIDKVITPDKKIPKIVIDIGGYTETVMAYTLTPF